MSNNNTPKPILHSIKDAARLIGVEPRQLREAINEGLVPHYRIRNSIMLVSVQEILSLMKSNHMEKANVK